MFRNNTRRIGVVEKKKKKREQRKTYAEMELRWSDIGDDSGTDDAITKKKNVWYMAFLNNRVE